jgi:hypothetical protein
VYLPVIEHVDKAETSMIPMKSDDENIKRNSTFINKRKDSHGTKKAMVMQTGLMAHKSRNSNHINDQVNFLPKWTNFKLWWILVINLSSFRFMDYQFLFIFLRCGMRVRMMKGIMSIFDSTFLRRDKGLGNRIPWYIF